MSRNLSGTRDGAGHAIVIGSSLAGLTAAAVLARHMERVTVIERDRLPSDAQWRPGVAQSRHAHNLMAAGHQGLGKLFPGIQQELLDAQMVSVRVPEDMLMLAPGGWIPRFETGMTMMTGTRDIVDAVVRDRLRAEPKVTFLQEHEVVGLQGGPGDSVSGVRVRAKDKDAKGGWGEPEPMAAEFVVDAAGRKSRAPQWLGELGYDKPAESVVDAKTAYGTTVYEPPAGHAADWKCILLLATPENPRQGILNPIEDGRWMVSVSASGGNRPPTDHEGMLEGAKSLRHPVVYEAIKDATPVGPVYGSGRTENRWRHFEKLRRWPDRFLVIGDALAAFNPSYGQGMSVAVQSALLLDRMLESRGTNGGGTHRLRRALAKQVAVAWQLATAIDLHYPWAAEASPPDLPTRLGMRYVDRVGAAAPADHDAARVVLELAQLLAAPTAVFRPRVLRSALRGPRGPVSTDPRARRTAPRPLPERTTGRSLRPPTGKQGVADVDSVHRQGAGYDIG
ncbi:2-polyprenyl-6-methoxyphenol hydroxylase-like oxidoreductase [Streptomyces sp. WAC 06738]|uniref:FAD-dependent oxidoreductase n=1 Tax=Streptomyces sp. WAC 06738 TaxID=2203210 RepID=UPI000F6F6DE8|nr:FAD-dependent monooxygenase [Streptomyces sp. WAC 06738]AZM45807.1 2-polyprenyl-6-methoxyphenol hydroxylase-like oxidoreductase [Streptomyces sp. WAC 06738]